MTQAFGFDAASAPELGQNRACLAQEDVLRLDSAVDKAARMHRAERGTDLCRDLNGVHEVQWTAISHMRQRVSQRNFKERHDKKMERTILADTLDGLDVWMRQLLDKRSLVSEACDRLWIERAGGGEDLDCYVAAGASLTATIDFTSDASG
jgi:hypothetical protein